MVDVDFLLKIVPQKYVSAAGLVVTQWAWVESVLDQYIWRLLGVRAMRGRIVTSNLMARSKIEVAAALLRKSGFDETLIRELEDEGRALANLRNIVAHGGIVSTPDQEHAIIGWISARGGALSDKTCLVTDKLLETLARRIATYLQFLIDTSARLPKQRGGWHGQDQPASKPRRLRPETIQRRLPPLLEVERQKGESQAEQEAKRAAKKAKKEADRRRDQAKKNGGS